uniref:Uncharacterized protein n=1 Tax=Kalanchoe fedtschenkoi TaxID=63787 RepID=A0A7N0ZYZ5_KALFE
MDSAKVEAGEIDTSAPIQSVKHAVSLFGAVAFSRKRPPSKFVEPHSTEQNIVAKETQLHLSEKEVMKLKERLQNADSVKSEALEKLEGANKVVEHLQGKLLIARESKDAAVMEAEMSNIKLKQLESENGQAPVSAWKEELRSFRDQYLTAILELNGVKQELTKIRQDYDSSLEFNVNLLKQASDADTKAQESLGISSELSDQIMALKESIMQERLASEKAQHDRARLFAEKDVQREPYKAKIYASKRQLQDLRKELRPESIRCIKLQHESQVTEIESLQKELDNAKVADLDSLRVVTLELGNVKEFHQEVSKKENTLRLLIESLTLELGNVKNEVVILTVKEAELESLAANLLIKLQKGKSEVEACAAEELKVTRSCDELISTLTQLSNESGSARQEVEDANVQIEGLKKEAEANRSLNDKAMLELRGLLREAELAKSAEADALDQLKLLSERTESARSSLSSSGAKLRLSKEEFGSLKRKVMESNTLTGIKIAAAMAQVDAIKASENEALNKLHSAQKEMEGLKLATADAAKSAAMSEAAKRALEGDIHRLREVELKKVGDEWSTGYHAIHNKSIPLEKMLGETWRSQDGGANLSKRTVLPSLSRIFRRK